MGSKRNFNDFYDEYSDEDHSVLDDDFENGEIDEEDSEIPEDLGRWFGRSLKQFNE